MRRGKSFPLFPVAAFTVLVVASCGAPTFETFSQECTGQVTGEKAEIPAQKLDVLFVVDDSPAMGALRPVLANHLGRLFDELRAQAAGGVYADLHVAVVSSDYGAGLGGA